MEIIFFGGKVMCMGYVKIKWMIEMITEMTCGAICLRQLYYVFHCYVYVSTVMYMYVFD